MQDSNLETKISGEIEKVVTFSEETGWAVLRISSDGKAAGTVVGEVVRADEGLRIEADGKWVQHPSFGPQFKATSTRIFEPQGVAGIERFLSSGAIDGVGKVFAKKIVDRHKEKTLDVIRKDPYLLKYIKGVGKKRIQAVIRGVRDYQDVLEVMSFLHEKFGMNRANKVFNKYGKEAKEVLEKDPYRLVDEVDGIGFALADQLAAQVGMTDEHPQRLEAAVMAVLNQAAQSGHTALPVKACEARVEKLVGGDDRRGEKAVRQGLESGRVLEVVREGQRSLETEKYRWLDQRVAKRLWQLSATPPKMQPIDGDKAVPWVEQLIGIEFEENQAEAIKTTLRNKISIVTGGPGVGKTTILNGLLRILKAKKQKVLLAAPTGRAARRLGESTGKQAETIHKLLDAQPGRGGFQFNEKRRLTVDTLIVDEMSMVDLSLMRGMLEAMPDDANLVMVGDAEQLPSVGAGQVLADLIESGAIPVARLKKPFRQAAGSPIIMNAHAVNAGQMPDLYGGGEEFQFLETRNAEESAEAIKQVVCVDLKNAGYDPISEVMALLPMNRGPVGVESMNNVLQRQLNPNPRDHIDRAGRRYALGDRVIQRKNDREIGVFNGDIGIIKGIDKQQKVLRIDFEGRKLDYPFGSLSALHLAFAITVHRSQGSEYKACVVAVDASNSVLLDRKLLYTAITRAKERVVIVGQQRALHVTVSEARANRRETHLAWRVAEEISGDLSELKEAVA